MLGVKLSGHITKYTDFRIIQAQNYSPTSPIMRGKSTHVTPKIVSVNLQKRRESTHSASESPYTRVPCSMSAQGGLLREHLGCLQDIQRLAAPFTRSGRAFLDNHALHSQV